MAIRTAAAKLFCDLDYVISPVSPVVNFPAEFAAPTNDPAKPFEHICYTVPWNMSENPAISINGGYDKKGFPIGVQIVGRRFDDLGTLGMAKAFEGLRGAQRPWPGTAEEVILNTLCHGRACPGHPRPYAVDGTKDVDARHI